MTLQTYVAELKTKLFAELSQGKTPSVGAFDGERLDKLRETAQPQMGATRFSPSAIDFEFIFSAPTGSNVWTIRVEAPERIVFLPVPDWVVETIWQGEIAGTHHFETDAKRLVEAFVARLEPDENAAEFLERAPTGRR